MSGRVIKSESGDVVVQARQTGTQRIKKATG
jgi:hypothetical protein